MQVSKTEKEKITVCYIVILMNVTVESRITDNCNKLNAEIILFIYTYDLQNIVEPSFQK